MSELGNWVEYGEEGWIGQNGGGGGGIGGSGGGGGHVYFCFLFLYFLHSRGAGVGYALGLFSVLSVSLGEGDRCTDAYSRVAIAIRILPDSRGICNEERGDARRGLVR